MIPQEIALELDDVVFRYLEHGKRNILDHVTMDIRAGTLTVLMGASGCGKSTLAAVAAGLYPENGGYLASGNIRLFGKPLAGMNPQQRASLLTMMFQNPDLQFCMDTLRKEMRFCMENICVPAQQMDNRIRASAEAMGVQELLDRKLSALSGGEKQKAALACLDVMESRCVLLDESFANIDRTAAAELLRMLRRMKSNGRTVIAIDHRADLWLDDADEFILLEEGARVAARGIRRDNLAGFRAVFEAHGLFYPSPFHGRTLSRPPSPDLLTFRDVSVRMGAEPKKRFGRKGDEMPFLLEHADASFPGGRMTAVLGPSGCGKTTTFLAVLKQHPYTGTIRLHGTDLRAVSRKELYKQAGIVFQNPANQFITQNVEEEIRTGLRIWDAGLSEAELGRRAQDLLEGFGLWKCRKYSPYMLSQGQQRRLAVLAVLSGEQKLLLLDEPTYGQDESSADAIMKLLRQKTDKAGLTVVFITHDRALAAEWADKIYLFEDRRLSERRPEEVCP